MSMSSFDFRIFPEIGEALISILIFDFFGAEQLDRIGSGYY